MSVKPKLSQPPLENSHRLTRVEFERPYQATSESIRAAFATLSKI